MCALGVCAREKATAVATAAARGFTHEAARGCWGRGWPLRSHRPPAPRARRGKGAAARCPSQLPAFGTPRGGGQAAAAAAVPPSGHAAASAATLPPGPCAGPARLPRPAGPPTCGTGPRRCQPHRLCGVDGDGGGGENKKKTAPAQHRQARLTSRRSGGGLDVRDTPSYFEGRSGCPLPRSFAPRAWTVGSVVWGVCRVCLGCVLVCSIAISYRHRGLGPMLGTQAVGTLRPPAGAAAASGCRRGGEAAMEHEPSAAGSSAEAGSGPSAAGARAEAGNGPSAAGARTDTRRGRARAVSHGAHAAASRVQTRNVVADPTRRLAQRAKRS